MTDRIVNVWLRANVANYNRNVASSTGVTGTFAGRLDDVDTNLVRVGKSADAGGRQIDRLSGRIRILGDLLAIATPGLATMGAVGVPALTALTAGAGSVVVAGGAMIGTLQGVGDALKAVNEARLNPTVENLAKARAEMSRLSPEARDLTRDLEQLGPVLRDLRDRGAEELLPGVSASIDNLEERIPDIRRILVRVNKMTADVLEDGTESLAGDRWDDWFESMAKDVPPMARDVATSIGNITHALAELWIAFAPVNRDGLDWLVDATDRLDAWATGLSQTRGFQEFIDYVTENGPQVSETLGSVAMALVRILEAAAPLGGPVLAAIEGVADAISAIADSGAGAPIMATVTALALLSRGQAVFGRISQSSWGQAMKGADGYAAKVNATRTAAFRATGVAAGLAIASTGAADGLGLTNTASMALMGSMAGPLGAAVGGSIGLFQDLNAVNHDLKGTTDEVTAAIESQSSALMLHTRAQLVAKIARQEDTNSLVDNLAKLKEFDWDKLFSEGPSMGAARNGMLQFSETGQLLYSELDRLDGAIARVGQQQGKFIGPVDAATAASRRQEDALRGVYRELSRVQGMLENTQGLVDYERALDDFTKRLKNRRGAKDFFDIGVEKGRQDVEAFKGLMDPLIAQVDRYREKGRDAAAQKLLTRAIGDLEGMNVKVPIVQRTLDRLRGKLADLNAAKAEPKLDADPQPALNAMDAVARGLRALDGTSATTHVWTVRHTAKEVQGGPPGRARGGPVMAGRSYIVGEQRPELFVPQVSGQIIPSLGGFAGGRAPEGTYGGGPLFDFDPGKGHKLAEVINDVSKVVRQLKVDLDDGPGGVRRTLRSFKRDLQQAGGEWTRRLEQNTEQIRRASERYDRLQTSIEGQQKAVDDANAALENIKSQQSSFESAIAGQFKTDLFGGGLAGLDKALSGDIANMQAKDAALQALVGMGVDPTSAFFRDLAERGDVKTLQQLAAAGPGAVGQYAALYGQRDALGGAIGSKYGGLSFGGQVDTATRIAEDQAAKLGALTEQAKDLQKQTNTRLDKLEKAVSEVGPKRTGEAVGKELAGAITKGWHEGKNK